MMLAVRAPQSNAQTWLCPPRARPPMAAHCACLTREKRGAAEGAQVRHENPIAARYQERRDIYETVNVVWPTMQENRHRSITRARFGIANVQNPGIDLLQRAERLVRSRFDRRHSCRFDIARLCRRRTDYAELAGRNRHYRGRRCRVPRARAPRREGRSADSAPGGITLPVEWSRSDA